MKELEKCVLKSGLSILVTSNIIDLLMLRVSVTPWAELCFFIPFNSASLFCSTQKHIVVLCPEVPEVLLFKHVFGVFVLAQNYLFVYVSSFEVGFMGMAWVHKVSQVSTKHHLLMRPPPRAKVLLSPISPPSPPPPAPSLPLSCPHTAVCVV